MENNEEIVRNQKKFINTKSNLECMRKMAELFTEEKSPFMHDVLSSKLAGGEELDFVNKDMLGAKPLPSVVKQIKLSFETLAQEPANGSEFTRSELEKKEQTMQFLDGLHNALGELKQGFVAAGIKSDDRIFENTENLFTEFTIMQTNVRAERGFDMNESFNRNYADLQRAESELAFAQTDLKQDATEMMKDIKKKKIEEASYPGANGPVGITTNIASMVEGICDPEKSIDDIFAKKAGEFQKGIDDADSKLIALHEANKKKLNDYANETKQSEDILHFQNEKKYAGVDSLESKERKFDFMTDAEIKRLKELREIRSQCLKEEKEYGNKRFEGQMKLMSEAKKEGTEAKKIRDEAAKPFEDKMKKLNEFKNNLRPIKQSMDNMLTNAKNFERLRNERTVNLEMGRKALNKLAIEGASANRDNLLNKLASNPKKFGGDSPLFQNIRTQIEAFNNVKNGLGENTTAEAWKDATKDICKALEDYIKERDVGTSHKFTSNGQFRLDTAKALLQNLNLTTEQLEKNDNKLLPEIEKAKRVVIPKSTVEAEILQSRNVKIYNPQTINERVNKLDAGEKKLVNEAIKQDISVRQIDNKIRSAFEV